MNSYRKWILCGVGWLLLYLYFMDHSLHTVWMKRVNSLGSCPLKRGTFGSLRFKYWPRSVSQLSSGMYCSL